MKRMLAPALKIIISSGFLFLVLKKVDLKFLLTIFKSADLSLLFLAYLLILSLTLFLACRWYLLLQAVRENYIFPFFLIWQMTMVGLFFNIFLPTGAGGDLAKVFFLVRNQEKKLLLGSSVLVDRFIGTLTVLTMALIAILLTPGLDRRVTFLVLIFFIFCCLAFMLLSSEKLAVRFSFLLRIFPSSLRKRWKHIYRAGFLYCSQRRIFIPAVGVSFLLQIVSIGAQYLMAKSLFPPATFGVSLRIFFIYVPLIWAATVIPSLGGLGVREYSYVFFFSRYLGSQTSLALSLLVLASVLLQSTAGGIVFLLMKLPAARIRKN